jgi:hypothetical protein
MHRCKINAKDKNSKSKAKKNGGVQIDSRDVDGVSEELHVSVRPRSMDLNEPKKVRAGKIQ